MKRDFLEKKYIDLGNKLQNKYSGVSFKNHCYWRIANDNACNEKWNNVVKGIYYKNCKRKQLIKSIMFLNIMLNDFSKAIELNDKSLFYRKYYCI